MEDGPGRTTPVDQYPQGDSAYCCADMAGNVWEWCADSYSETFEVERTGITWQDVKLHGQLATESEDKRSLRGGSYAEDKQAVICSNRIGRTLTETSPTIGFRVAVSSGWE
jgi:formylglycine-generating enzyme required for sulfatase activity